MSGERLARGCKGYKWGKVESVAEKLKECDE